ncbi:MULTISPECIES: hypothetical protein [Bacillaceae]|uniref:hypothetical protein n=1 Tax=Bacillaceae TaxID=186817 RepID=UPI00101C749D|nr:hypothetical protein [Ectobacillus funiculus]
MPAHALSSFVIGMYHLQKEGTGGEGGKESIETVNHVRKERVSIEKADISPNGTVSVTAEIA